MKYLQTLIHSIPAQKHFIFFSLCDTTKLVVEPKIEETLKYFYVF